MRFGWTLEASCLSGEGLLGTRMLLGCSNPLPVQSIVCALVASIGGGLRLRMKPSSGHGIQLANETDRNKVLTISSGIASRS